MRLFLVFNLNALLDRENMLRGDMLDDAWIEEFTFKDKYSRTESANDLENFS